MEHHRKRCAILVLRVTLIGFLTREFDHPLQFPFLNGRRPTHEVDAVAEDAGEDVAVVFHGSVFVKPDKMIKCCYA